MNDLLLSILFNW